MFTVAMPLRGGQRFFRVWRFIAIAPDGSWLLQGDELQSAGPVGPGSYPVVGGG